MSRKKVIIPLLLLLMVMKVCFGDQQLPDLREKLGKILKWCFGEQLSPVVATTDLIDTFHGPMWDDDPVVLIQIDEHFDPGKSQWIYQQWPTFALTVDSEETLEFFLQKLKDSTYWNIKCKLFIVSDKGVCGDASKMLQVAWKMNLLSAFYLCHDAKGDVSLYTFNPFTDRAPNSWIKVENTEATDDDRWTLYKRSYSEGPDFCQGVDFDRTKQLDGFKVKAIAESYTAVKFEENKDYDASSLSNYSFPQIVLVFKHLWSSMNVTPVIHYNEVKYYENDTLIGSLAKLNNGSYDIGLNIVGLIYSHLNITPTYPFVQQEIAILSRHRKFLTPAEKIANYYTVEIMSLTIVVLVITWLIFLIRNNGQRVQAFLEILRMVVSTGLLQKLERTPIRIYLFGVLWLILILNATFQGNLAAFLTRPERHDVNSMKDLKTHGYDIYITKIIFDLLPPEMINSVSKDKIYLVDNCRNFSTINSSISACVSVRYGLIELAKKHHLHVSRDSLAIPYLSYWFRKDWPLADKLNVYYWRLMESGLIKYSIETSMNPEAKLKDIEDRETAPVIRPLTLDDLSFAFPILAVGLIISTIVFIVELRGWKDKSKVRPEVANQSISYRGRFKMRNNIIIGYRDDI